MSKLKVDISRFIKKNEPSEKVQEAYVKRGPAKRIKANVVPVKIWVRKCGKSEKGCYRTYYVAGQKRALYSELAKRALQNKEVPKYLLYFNEVGPRFKQIKVASPWQRKYLGETFTNQFAHLSGLVYGAQLRYGRRAEPGADEVVFSHYDANTGTHTVKLKNGIEIQSTFRIGKQGGSTLIV